MHHPLSGIDIKSLLILQQLLQHNSVKQVAKQMGLQQGTVTYHLNKLREHFNDPLYIPSGRGIEPTPKALSLATPLYDAISSLERVIATEDFQPIFAKGTIRIAMPGLGALHVIPELVNRLQETAPGIVVETSLWNESTEQELLEGKFELTFNVISELSPQLYGVEVGKMPMCAVYDKRHPLNHSTEWPQSAFDYPYVAIAPQTHQQQSVESLAKSYGKTRQIIAGVASYQLLAKLLEGSNRVSIISVGSAALLTNSTLTSRPIKALPPTTIHCYWHQRSHNDPLHRFVRNELIDICRRQISDISK
ncbi:LysR family transcriptional regulator [Vibrio astriarenae]|uniref:LysR family transcriptional regulator n=1 Tax=Vibrio astriarenae TaxID=1481923 RepID=A0A7Z2T7A3_9VIBR|nr:LysR family transcriptional regulator [Vibrio astriarenae]QIA65592.1 LysR family transcriptional regulator [Vibrio astriarenae]